MAINVKCNKCGETGVRQNQGELAQNKKCKVCGGELKILPGSVMDVPIESVVGPIVKSVGKQIGGMIEKRKNKSSEKVADTFVTMQTSLDDIVDELKKQTDTMGKWMTQDEHYHKKQLEQGGS